jgi:hypothetical protein
MRTMSFAIVTTPPRRALVLSAATILASARDSQPFHVLEDLRNHTHVKNFR